MATSVGGSSSSNPPLHVVLIPLMAQGHMIPMVDMARLFAARGGGVIVTVITTPANASRFRQTLPESIRLVDLPFPSEEAGLPEGCENLDALPSKDHVPNFFAATALFRQPVENHLISRLQPSPASCIISDMGLPWTGEIARGLGIPRLVFHGTCCFSMLCTHMARQYLNSHESDVVEPFVVPGLPHKIQFTRAQLPGSFAAVKPSAMKSMQSVRDEIIAAEAATHGVVVNSFSELEAEYVENYEKATGKKAWTLGPVSLCIRGVSEKTNRGNRASIGSDECLTWLDRMKTRSVVYVSFGSIARFTPQQQMEIGLGLEASNSPFIWVINTSSNSSSWGEEVERWISEEGFEERVKDRGLLIRGWAPQVVILAHPAVGGFLTHCGWNSTLEGVTAGLPLITWPLFAEQFLNEKLVVEVLAIGVSLGVVVPTRWGEEDKAGVVVVGREDIRKAVERLMGVDDEGKERRRRARDLANMATKAMEVGGSSYENMTDLIEDIRNYSSNNLV